MTLIRQGRKLLKPLKASMKARTTSPRNSAQSGTYGVRGRDGSYCTAHSKSYIDIPISRRSENCKALEDELEATIFNILYTTYR